MPGALRNMACNNDQRQAAVAAAGAIPALVLLLGHISAGVQSDATWALHNLCANVQHRATIGAIPGAIPAVVQLLNQSSDADVQVAATRTLQNLAYQSSQNQAAIANAGVSASGLCLLCCCLTITPTSGLPRRPTSELPRRPTSEELSYLGAPRVSYLGAPRVGYLNLKKKKKTPGSRNNLPLSFAAGALEPCVCVRRRSQGRFTVYSLQYAPSGRGIGGAA
jgi:hypothetical protein